MSRLRIVAFCLTVMTLTAACDWDGGRGRLDEDAYSTLSGYFGVHPRLILGPGKQDSLRTSLDSGLSFLWERFQQDLPSRVSAAADIPDRLGRGHGDLAAELAFAWLMTDTDSLRVLAVDYLLRLCRKPVWDPEYDLLHGHLLLGVSLAYDWLYHELGRDRRIEVADRLGEEALEQYRRITEGRVWYRNQYLQNHAHVNYGGLAFAAAALYGEDPRAQDWLGVCDSFFTRVFELSAEDGTSVEGLSYGNYAIEYCLRYAELARDLLGKDYYSSSWLRNYPDYVLHSLLPRPSESEWAMTFGDSPRHGNSHGPEPQLYLLASRTGNRNASRLADRLINLRPEGLASASWWALAWYSPSGDSSFPVDLPRLMYFSDLDQVMLRSSWADSAATMIGIKCGPFMGRRQTGAFRYDLGAAHGHPDAASFQLYSRGRFLAIDPGYTMLKRTANHNTLMVKGQGQLGELETWFAAGEALVFDHNPRVIETRSAPDYDYVLVDAAQAYHPGLGLTGFRRHFLFLRPDMLLVADEINLQDRGVLHNLTVDSLELSGNLRRDGAYAVGESGAAEFVFNGAEGAWSIGISYIDNSPGTGRYSLLVDSVPVAAWRDTVTITDTHYRVFPDIKLRTGSRVEFRGAPMGRDARLVKIALWSRESRVERDVDWLLHFEPGTTIAREYTRIQAVNGPAALDVYPLAPERRTHDWGPFSVLEGRQFQNTVRLKIKPVFSDSATVMLNLLHARGSGEPPLDRLTGTLQRGTAALRWFEGGRPVSVSLDLGTGQVSILRQPDIRH